MVSVDSLIDDRHPDSLPGENVAISVKIRPARLRLLGNARSRRPDCGVAEVSMIHSTKAGAASSASLVNAGELSSRSVLTALFPGSVAPHGDANSEKLKCTC